MEEIDQMNDFKNEDKRPSFLVVLCILSYVSIGFTLLTNIMQFVKGPLSAEDMKAQNAVMAKTLLSFEEKNLDYFAVFFKKIMMMTESLNNSFYSVYFFSLISGIIGLFGVIKMWKGKKLGFHLYIIYSLLGVGQIYLFVSPSYIPNLILYTNLFISGIFVFMYSRNLKWMK